MAGWWGGEVVWTLGGLAVGCWVLGCVCTGSNTELYDCGSIYTLSSQPGSEVSHNYIVNQVLLYGVRPSLPTRLLTDT